MKVIDLLNKKANGEEVPKKIRIDHWCYKFEWIEHQSNYYDKHNEIDLMSCLSCDKEELNYEVHEIKEPKGIPEKLEILPNNEQYSNKVLYGKINEILDYLESKGESNEKRYEECGCVCNRWLQIR